MIFDVVILILLLLTAWKGYRRGFVLTLCSLLAVFVAFIGATVISSQLARPMSRLIQPALERSITQVLEEQTHAVLPPPETSEASQPPALSDAFSGEEGQEGEEDWLAQLPLDEVLDALQASSLYQHFIQPIQDAIQDGVMEVTTSAARAVADYLALELTRMFLFLVSFALVLLLWLLLSRVLDLACKLPVLSTLNHWSGAALGLGWLGSAVVFAIVSVALLLVARPILRRRMEAALPSLDTHHRTMAGRSAEVVERVDGESGRVRIAGELWSARSLDGHEVIEAGATATVMEVTGAVALVTGRGEISGD